MSRDSYRTDRRLMQAIEGITGGNLDCAGECGNHACDGTDAGRCADVAVALWRAGGREDELRAWLDTHYQDWRDDAPIDWGEGYLRASAAPGCRDYVGCTYYREMGVVGCDGCPTAERQAASNPTRRENRQEGTDGYQDSCLPESRNCGGRE